MSRSPLALAALVLAIAAAAPAQVRPPAWAGQFYDGDPARLSAALDEYFRGAGASTPGPGRIVALVVPHAGYVYSGAIAASAYALVKGGDYDTVVIVGPAHRYGFEGCSIYPKGAFRTPLGEIPVDEGVAAALARASGFGFIPEAHEQEHSVEVQVPFVQKALSGARIVPVVMGFQTRATVEALARGLEKALAGKKALVVASTDLSHQLPRARAAEVDADTAALVRDLKTATLLRKVENGENIMCGGGPVAAALLYAQKAGKPSVRVVRTGDSSENGGPAENVVGYMAAVVTLPAGAAAKPETKADAKTPLSAQTDEPEFSLTEPEKAELLKMARTAVELYVRDKQVLATRSESPKLREPRAAFVTLRKKGDLRGCIGYLEPVAPLDQTVVRVGILAAVEDTRFTPVTPDELSAITVEVSVLTPIRDISSPLQVRVGRDGLVVSMGSRRGLLLPQVAVENGWDRETFLSEGCVKAGLPPDAWRHGAKLATFQAIVFGEK